MQHVSSSQDAHNRQSRELMFFRDLFEGFLCSIVINNLSTSSEHLTIKRRKHNR